MVSAPYVAAPPSPSTAHQQRENPLSSASLFSQLLVLWFQPLVSLGARQPLSSADIWPVCISDSCSVLERRLEGVYDPQDASVPLASTFLRLFQPPLLLVLANYSVYIAAMALQSYVAQALLDFLNDRPNVFHVESGYALVGLMMLTSAVAVTCRNFAFFVSSRVGINLRTLVMDLVFQKTLRLSCVARQQYTTGEVLTLMSVDAERLFNFVMMGPWLYVAPLGLVVSLALIGLLFDGWSALCGVVVLVAVFVLSIHVADKIAQIQHELFSVVDERVKVTSEALQGVRVIKFYAWEESIAARLQKIRAAEVGLFRKLHFYMVSNSVLLFLTPVFLSGSTLGLYVQLHGSISVTDAFTLIALVNICRAVVPEFPVALAALSQAQSSFRRIDKFLASHEFNAPGSRLGDNVGRVCIRNASFEWPTLLGNTLTIATDTDVAMAEATEMDDINQYSSITAQSAMLPPNNNSFALKGIDLEIEAGSLVMIVGAVGSGKSSFLHALLGEMVLQSGGCEVHGAISYVSQEPWIRNATVKSNILFESSFDAERYGRVLEASQLSVDLGALPNGDQTEIGEKGINLSGGQKARVGIARALYRSEYDILILDDPLSAVDPHVAHGIFDECVVGLAENKTRLLVLNSHYELLSEADRVLAFKDGQIVGNGSYQEIVSLYPELQYQSKHAKKADLPRGEEEKQAEATTDGSPQQNEIVKEEGVKLIKDEDRVTGTVGGHVYKAYFDETGFNGITVLLVLFVAYAVSQGTRVLVDWWQGHWASNMDRKGVDPTYSGTAFGMWYLGFIVICTVLTLARGFVMTEACIRSAKNLHDELFRRVLSAPVNRYFDVTPVGRILNRFSNDLDQMDSILPQQYQLMFQNVAMTLGSLVVSAVSSYWIGVSYLPMLMVFVFTGRYFNKTSREVKRLEGISRTPVYNLFGETLTGLQTIRAFKMQDKFADLAKNVVDDNTATYFSYYTAGRWLAVRLDWLSVVIIFVVSLYLVATKGQITPVVAGISLTYSLMLTSTMQNTVRAVDQTDNAMTSVERLLHFRKIPSEDDNCECLPMTSSWPPHGAITFDNLCLKYRPELPLVLRGVSMTIGAGEKVGICGRTGAGKSSLMIALFRICEFESGSVKIGGVDIQNVRLTDLRRSLAIIPQDPVLFSGTLRENMDPFGAYSDADVWKVLQQVHLADAVTKWGAGLNFVVSEAGDNLSVGQRQLLCIGRALLKKSKIVVLDEATASVDSATDNLIQATIKQTFADQTVLIIAHRINTILHCDKIAVMDAGVVAEFAPPSELLTRSNSIFAALAKRTAGTL
ncbi:hypothetical protein PHYBOEH_001857 [Phytophthora boehmeriae]|uniref:Uncharacterized protein n=1 Tax=Phytophthora boehmeriae TaxID=109152 RepID=A0A8T1WY97_9STRA|nr:hypothetical protein PHYBOEH_001857 [Phytophthora boehmeriae]